MRNPFTQALAVALILTVYSAIAEVRRPNVVIFFTDDQGTLDANCYGSKDLHTPTMDQLAETGVRFTQAYAHTVCCPARAALLTGRHPQRSKINTWTQGNHKEKEKGLNMPLEEITIAEILKDSGYQTGLFGKWHLGADLDHGPMAQGFDEFYGLRGGFIDNYNHYFLHGMGFHDLFDAKEETFETGDYFPDLMTARAPQFVDKNKDQPFFMYVAFNIPHYPEQPDPQFDQRYKDLPMPRKAYAKMISTTDERMGRIIKKLDEHGLRDDTIIIFMSDNGASEEDYSIRVENHASGLAEGHDYGAHGGGGNTGKWRGAKGSYFEGGIRVPAIISYPKQLPAGIVRDQVVTVMDWLPTIAQLCAAKLPRVELDGQSLLPIIQSAETPSHHKTLHWQFQKRWAVRQGDWKLISNHRGKPQILTNLAEQQPEAKNHFTEKPGIAEALHQLHKHWIKQVAARK